MKRTFSLNILASYGRRFLTRRIGAGNEVGFPIFISRN
jgi:hypothetical protein